MADDVPPDPEADAKRRAFAEKHGLPIDQVTFFRLNPWEWAAARGLKPLPGKEIPPEYRHLFPSPAAGRAAKARGRSAARARIYRFLVAEERMRREKLPVQ